MKPLNYDTPVVDTDGSLYPLGRIKSDISTINNRFIFRDITGSVKPSDISVNVAAYTEFYVIYEYSNYKSAIYPITSGTTRILLATYIGEVVARQLNVTVSDNILTVADDSNVPMRIFAR